MTMLTRELFDADVTETMTLDGQAVPFSPGETILEVAARHGKEIPSLCHDPRLKPVGACRTCLVEISGWRRLAPSCLTKATAGMEVSSENSRIDRHRKGLLALYALDHPETERATQSGRPNELLDLIDRFDAPTDWAPMTSLRDARPGDENPYVGFDPDTCIACARCVRYCEEVEAVSAITLANRGSLTTIATVDSLGLLDTTCEMCGGCIDVCPTGAMHEKMPLAALAKPEAGLEKVRTTCNYCGVGCQMDLNVDRDGNGGKGRVVKVTSPVAGTTMNDGNLCVKGRFAYEFLNSDERLMHPLVRDDNGRLVEASWKEALKRASEGLRGVQERHGADALAFVSSSRCTVEENYLVQKMSRAVFRTNNVHQCAAT